MHYLRTIVSPEGAAQTVLPSMRFLANQANVSLVTMWKAVALLKQEGTLIGGYGHRIKTRCSNEKPMNSPTSDSQVGNPVSRNALRIKEDLQRDIINHNFEPGSRLPSGKELQKKYNSSSRTIRNVLYLLHEERIIIPAGKGYRIRDFSDLSSDKRIVIVVWGEKRGIFAQHQFELDVLREFEYFCSMARVRLDIIVATLEDGEIVFSQCSQTASCIFPSGDSIAGYACCISDIAYIHEELLQLFVQLKKPVVLLDLIGGWRLNPPFASNRLFRVVTSSIHDKPGYQVGRYLIDKGHKSVAWIAPFHQEEWSINRLKGLVKAYSAAGVVFPCVIAQTFFDAEVYRIGSEVAGEPSDFKMSIKNGNLQRDTKIEPPTRQLTQTEIHRLGTSKLLETLLKKAIDDPLLTAWVFSSDYSAKIALDYCVHNNLKVPQDISLISFDDSAIALQNRITSYNFNVPALASVTLRYLLHPSDFGGFYRRLRIIIEGKLTERSSVQNMVARKS